VGGEILCLKKEHAEAFSLCCEYQRWKDELVLVDCPTLDLMVGHMGIHQEIKHERADWIEFEF
jgi:hypothetical protein